MNGNSKPRAASGVLFLAYPSVRKGKSFWQSVSELAKMRKYIPEERRALSAVRQFFSAQVKKATK